MVLPKINVARLQQVVTSLESGRKFRSFEELSFKVAGSNWAVENELDAATVRELITHHKIDCKTLNPPAPPPAKPKPVPAPAPAPVPPAQPPPATAPPTPPRKPPTKPAPPPQPEPKPVPPPKVEAPVPPPKVEAPVVVTPPAEEEEPTSGSDVPTYDEGGRGRKQCPNCKKYVGNRTGVCACGHEFVEDSKTESGAGHVRMPAEWIAREQLGSGAAQEYGCRNILWTPAGKPPVELKGFEREHVEKWAEGVRAVRRSRDGCFVSLEALRYYVGMAMGLKPEERSQVVGHLREIYPDE